VPFHYLYQDPTGDRARALIAENISLFQKSTDVTCVPPLASQNNSISLPENIGEGSFRASLAPLVTSSPDPANQIPQSQNAELNNSAPNSLIARIAQLPISATVITDFLDLAAQELIDAITESAKAAIPISKPGARAKPWWSHDLLNLRQNMIRAQRLIIYSDADSIRQYLSAKNTYFQAIKQAKREHWNSFLEKEDPKSIFKAIKYTKSTIIAPIPPIKSSNGDIHNTFEAKANTLRNTLFPPPPITAPPSWSEYQQDEWDWPDLTASELSKACSMKIKGKTPGPDAITQVIITRAYTAIPDTFFRLYSALIDIGHHPTCWKQATSAILKKPGKPDYSVPKAYRVISLLNCLGKISERVLAQRLAYLAETTRLLHPSQIGGRLKKSAVDAALLLTNEVELNKRAKWKTSTLLLDIKGAFDHVAKNQLLSVLQELKLPASLII
jgi:5'-deoxynucleotidase YfbR-like HD superfamily hydrolase